MKQFFTLCLTTGILLLTIASTFAQNNCDSLKKENEYLRKALKITTPVKTITSSKIDFNIINCEGNIKEQTVELLLMLVNHDANKEISFYKAVAIDMEGNEYKANNIKVGSDNSSNIIYTDTPIKTTISFSKVLPAVKILKLIAISFFSSNPKFEYRDIAITWK